MISSSVTGSVVSWPWTTMPSESPTRSTSAPDSSSNRANVASYAVNMAIFSPRSFICRRVWMVTRVDFNPPDLSIVCSSCGLSPVRQHRRSELVLWLRVNGTSDRGDREHAPDPRGIPRQIHGDVLSPAGLDRVDRHLVAHVVIGRERVLVEQVRVQVDALAGLRRDVDDRLRDRLAELAALVNLHVVAAVLVEQVLGVDALGPDVAVQLEVVAGVAARVVDRARLQRDEQLLRLARAVLDLVVVGHRHARRRIVLQVAQLVRDRRARAVLAVVAAGLDERDQRLVAIDRHHGAAGVAAEDVRGDLRARENVLVRDRDLARDVGARLRLL